MITSASNVGSVLGAIVRAYSVSWTRDDHAHKLSSDSVRVYYKISNHLQIGQVCMWKSKVQS